MKSVVEMIFIEEFAFPILPRRFFFFEDAMVIFASILSFIEPVFSPLGLDWRYGVAIIASFLAREVFVGTLGTIFGIESADEDPASLADQIAASGLTAASGVALVVFFTVALQCVSTVALLAREAKSARFAVQLLLGYLVLAWLVAWLVYSLASLLLV